MVIKMKIKIMQKKISKNHNDSVWYEGEIAIATTKKGTKLSLIACGDIRICKKGGDLVFDGQERGDCVKGGFKSDKDLKKIGQNYNDKYYWDNNNWFEVMYMPKGTNTWECVLGDVAYYYDDAIKLLKSYDKEF